MKGTRDITSGLFVTLLMANGSPALLGEFLAVASLIPFGDAASVLRSGGKKPVAFGIHGATALVMLAAAAILIAAATKHQLIMPIFHISIANAAAWLLALGFIAAGIANAAGGADIQAQFQRWGYPAWWNFVTAALELLDAGLIVFPETRIFGLALGATVTIAATTTVIWRREYKHLPPCLVFIALIGINLALVIVH